MATKFRALLYLAVTEQEKTDLKARAVTEKEKYQQQNQCMEVYSDTMDGDTLQMLVLIEEPMDEVLGDAPWTDGGGRLPAQLLAHFFCQIDSALSVNPR